MISLIILGIIFLYAIISYNTLTRKRNNVDNAFGSIDVMLKKKIRPYSQFSRYCTAIRETRRRDVC